MNDVIAARAIHVLSIVIWIGGVAMITFSILPAARNRELGPDRLKAFEAIERRFASIARIAVLLAGLSGLYMVHRLDLWSRFSQGEFWWMHAMIFVWLVFAFLLFIAEPLFLHRIFHNWGRRDPDAALKALQRGHIVLLALSLVTIFGAVAGAQGWSLF
ncbi:conserved hypothetical protein [Methylocella silvestris BL2]|uniref:Copper resistance protein D domain-containing protein n=1 Tax=Methylocella silvestris (strain DSM 15510 / CIP 108128 / LMG 27833 / NCIMB 13906 / BL2) TaxID=395965 RepID=B8EMJ2_METSB|nr:membrane protein [Methylocella silvestris]ACK52120.1 conserved hypothetical protein [Methylocella silvestris BL2]